MRKLMIVLLISVMLLSIPCATAASFSDLFTASVSPEDLEIASSDDVPSVNMKIFVIDKDKHRIISDMLRIIFYIKKHKPVKPPVEPQGN